MAYSPSSGVGDRSRGCADHDIRDIHNRCYPWHQHAARHDAIDYWNNDNWNNDDTEQHYDGQFFARHSTYFWDSAVFRYSTVPRDHAESRDNSE